MKETIFKIVVSILERIVLDLVDDGKINNSIDQKKNSNLGN
ncbi:hypothetical protein [Riemerella columbipharyngis]|uniref:Uncharacterized protein n=1 Tax=Riemerella columbipharyngis TaxID=1071918 RepID=A0A1G6ZII2_9FLAO|nr:hypothetical protein [Riemerella columbipharyngis]SDE01072.1 hypothetical protein SAMN05421544_10258 [Riemerella columbipharyngis]SDE01366.1 hypothetical protein SAMN05421544_10268 [Riemerella columbipharyngis]